MIALAKYLKQYFRADDAAVQVLPGAYSHEGVQRSATIWKPVKRARGTAWVVLHGMTFHGPRHTSLQRFASALAAAGNVVLVPEISEWMQLHVRPALTPSIINGAVHALAARGDVDASRIGVFGFSFGATQALIAATEKTLADRVRTLVAWGGYAQIENLVHFGFTGEHEIDGRREHILPDPYARWIFGANYLTSISEYRHLTSVSDALYQLAREAGRSGVYAGDPYHDHLKRQLAESLHGEERRVYELFAPTGAYDMTAARELGDKLARAVVTADPLMDPQPFVPHVRVPTVIAHGRDDRLIPYTESIRLKRSMPAAMLEGFTITSLFSHSGGTQSGLGPVGLARESQKFLSVLNRIFNSL